jgi:glycosyltransferase involved in cell wall biosynthesis
MRLDVVVPTLDRAPLLERTLHSLLSAPVPDGLDVRVIVVDNGCMDGTPARLRELQEQNPGRLEVLCERRRGKSRALNAGIALSDADLIGMVDDDEEIDTTWYQTIHALFQDPTLDFAGGPYIPRWEGPPPEWLPDDYLAVIGAANSGDVPQPYTADFPGILKGGNAVIRRQVLLEVGPYAEWLGPSGDARLLSCEDEEMYYRLLKAGKRGIYTPALVIYHHVSRERLEPRYFRRWCFWRGVSRGLMDRTHPLPVPYLAGVPRFLVGRASRGALRLMREKLNGNGHAGTFSDELSIWDVAGYFWGRQLYTLSRLSPLKSRRSNTPT